MSCNCPDTNKCPSPTTCLCGLETNIYNPSGVLVETVTAYPIDVEGTTIYQIFNSTAFESTLGQSYTLTIAYNYELERWEMTYFNDELSLTILLGVLYGVEPDSCPVNNCWDLDCIAIAFRVLGTFDTYFSWDGTYVNGKKSYIFSSSWSGSSIDYRIYWVADSSTFPSADAPVGTPAWILEEEVSPGVWQPAGYLFNNNQCPYGQYIVQFGGIDTRFSFTDLGVTGFDLKTSILDCGCCDTEVVITIDGDEYTATVQYDEYGNVLVYGGVNYYTFTIGESTYYIFYLNGQWVVKEELSESAETIYSLTSTNECPFGSYADNIINQITNCTECVKTSFTYLGIDYEFQLPSIGTSNGKSIYAIVGVDIGPYLNSDIVISWVNTPSPRWNYSFITTPISSISNDTLCPLGNFPNSTTPEALFTNIVVNECGSFNPTLINVKGVKCFDCCDYDTPKNRNLLKKKKAIFVDEISSIRNKEIFGFNCGPEWDDLFKKHLIFDVLWCLPYGKICDEEQQCLINNLNENCNC